MKKDADIHSGKIIHHLIKENGFFPNNAKLPLLHYKKAFDLAHLNSGSIKKLFLENEWKNTWVDSIFQFHHYHSNTHEVLGISRGSCSVELGGERGLILGLEKGDALIIPAGVSHKNVGSSKDFECVGAYPFAISYDMNYGTQEESSVAIAKIKSVPLPKTDPVYGVDGPLFSYWK